MTLINPPAKTERKAAKLLSSSVAGVALCVLTACDAQTTSSQATPVATAQWQQYEASTQPSAS